jgi:hypothetical protein
MKRVLSCLFLFSGFAACAQGQATSPRKIDVSGSWILREQMFDEVQIRRMSLQRKPAYQQDYRPGRRNPD